MAARVASIQVGRTEQLETFKGTVKSAFRKQPVEGPVMVRRLGLDGDEQGSPKIHGGPEKAVCAYPGEHYPYWAERLERAMPPASFGENLTTEGLLEDEVEVGATYRVGEAVVQVSQPRAPCFKIAGRHGVKRLTAWLQETGRTGFYLRVLEEGSVWPGARVELLSRPDERVTIAELNRVAYQDRADVEALAKAAAAEGLEEGWRTGLERQRERALAR